MAEKDNRRENSGRKYNQRMKPYLILQYLLRKTDSEHTVSAEKIAKDYLIAECGI